MIGTILKGMLKAGFDTVEIASFCNQNPDLFPDMHLRCDRWGRRLPVREGDVWNQIARVDHLDLMGAA